MSLVKGYVRARITNPDLAMKAFGTMRELFDRRDLARVYNVLMEKEIRIHGELEGMEEGPTKAIELPLDPDSDDE